MMDNITVRCVNGCLKMYFGELDVTPFATGPSPSTGQKQRYPGRFVQYLNAHYPLEGQRILEMFAGSGQIKQFRMKEIDERLVFDDYNQVLTTDLREETGCDITSPYDEFSQNYKGKKFDVVIADPPYNAGFANEWTDHKDGLPKPKRIQRESAKVLRMGGLCMILHVIQVPAYRENGMKLVAIHPILGGSNNAARTLTVTKKVMQFDEAQTKFKPKRKSNKDTTMKTR